MPIIGKKEVVPHVDSLLTFFEAAVFSNPSLEAVFDVSNEEKLTFQQLSTRAIQFARYLLKFFSKLEVGTKSFHEDRIVSICMEPSIDLIVTLIAILKIGGAYIPMDTEFPQTRVNHILRDAKPKVLISKGNPSAVEHLKYETVDGVHLIDLDTCVEEINFESKEEIANEEREVDSSLQRIAAILYTSGSTGIPKGVRIPHLAVINRLIWQWRTFPYEINEVCCFKTALTFVDSISEIFGPLLTGHKVIIIPKVITKNSEKLVEKLRQFNVYRLVLVPTLLRSILLECSRRNSQSLDNLKLWICSGEPFPPDLLHAFFRTLKKGQTICNFYGSTEVMGDVTYIQFSSADDVANSLRNNKVPIGKPISNCSIYLVNKDLEEVPEGNVGEILASGLNLASGFVGGIQQEKFIPNPHCSESGYNTLYRTGDFGSYQNNLLFYDGRTDSQIKVRGHRVDLNEVQAAIQSINGTIKCCALCYRPGEADQALVAFYTTTDADITVEFLKLQMATLLPPYMLPQLINVDELPLLVNGKMDRQKLLKQFEEREFRKTFTETELDLTNCSNEHIEIAKTLLKTVVKVLGPSAPSKISLDQNFFEIGGNSLNAILVLTTFQDAGYQIGVNQFLKSKNLRDIVTHAAKTEEDMSQPALQIETLGTEKHNEFNEYKCFLLKPQFKSEAIKMLAKSFSNKGDLELVLDVVESDFDCVLDRIWPHLLQQALSFVVCRADSLEEIVAISVNSDFNAEPDLGNLPPKLQYIFDFIDDCESKVRHHLPHEVGKVLHSILMATRDDILSSENVTLIRLMEKENFRVAKRNGYKALFTTNSSNLTQHICEDMLGYKVLGSNPFNQWIAKDGKRPFHAALDEQIAVCSAFFIQD